MPYDVHKSGTKFQVVGGNSGRIFGTHDTAEQARNQQQALYANAKDPRNADPKA